MKIKYKSVHGRDIEYETEVPSAEAIRSCPDKYLREFWLISSVWYSGEEALDIDFANEIIIEDEEGNERFPTK